MFLSLLALLIGFALGFVTKASVPAHLAPYTAVALLAAFDSLLGGVRSVLQASFDDMIFVTGLLSNALLAALLAFVGDRIGVNLYLAAIFAFGVRIFQNLAIIRRILLTR